MMIDITNVGGMAKHYETVGQRIRRERRSRGMTQQTLAEKVGVGVPHVSKVETGRENPSDELLSNIADTYGCDLDELMLTSKRMPTYLIERFAAYPQQALRYLQRWEPPGR